MGRDREYRARVVKTINVENDIWNDFQEYCKSEKISMSRALQGFIIEALEKNALGDKPNAIGILYNLYSKPKKHSESENVSLDMWIQKIQTIDSLQELGRLKGYHKLRADKIQVRMNQIKRYNLA
jgi:hypothetical protein